MGNVLHVAAAIILDGNRVLGCRRRPGNASGGRWEFPGGKIEPGETPEEAARREIAEELNAEIRVHGELTTDETEVGGSIIRLTCVTANITGKMPVSSTDHDALEWIPLESLSAYDWAEPDLPAVSMLVARAG